MSAGSTITKTIWQYSEPLPEETMEFLKGIAIDYCNVEYFKHKRPHIPYEQRAEIVAAIREVDRVVPVSFHNTKKIDAWNLYHFDCHFSGNDHGSDWAGDLEQLKAVGSNMEFFEYTQGISSTQIKQQLMDT